MSTDNLNGTLSSTGNLNGTFGTSGGGGTSNYNDLANKPQINGNTLEGNKTPAQLGINIPDMTNYYNKSETNTLLDGKANVSDLPDMNDYYNKSETDNLLDGKVDNSDFNAASLPITSGSATNTKDYIDSAISALENYSLTDYSTNIASNWNVITSSGCYAMKIGNVGIITVRIKTNASISSGSLNLSTLPFASPREIWGSLSSLDNKGGFIQLNGKELLIRCSASPDNFLAGQVVVPIST